MHRIQSSASARGTAEATLKYIKCLITPRKDTLLKIVLGLRRRLHIEL